MYDKSTRSDMQSLEVGLTTLGQPRLSEGTQGRDLGPEDTFHFCTFAQAEGRFALLHNLLLPLPLSFCLPPPLPLGESDGMSPAEQLSAMMARTEKFIGCEAILKRRLGYNWRLSLVGQSMGIALVCHQWYPHPLHTHITSSTYM